MASSRSTASERTSASLARSSPHKSARRVVAEELAGHDSSIAFTQSKRIEMSQMRRQNKQLRSHEKFRRRGKKRQTFFDSFEEVNLNLIGFTFAVVEMFHSRHHFPHDVKRHDRLERRKHVCQNLAHLQRTQTQRLKTDTNVKRSRAKQFGFRCSMRCNAVRSSANRSSSSASADT